jgi:hypothetical protein
MQTIPRGVGIHIHVRFIACYWSLLKKIKIKSGQQWHRFVGQQPKSSSFVPEKTRQISIFASCLFPLCCESWATRGACGQATITSRREKKLSSGEAG